LHDANRPVNPYSQDVCTTTNDAGLHRTYNWRMVTRIGPKQPKRHYLRAWREKRHLTQEQLAARLGTHKGQISNWENGRRDMSMGVQAAIAEALGLDNPGDLFRDPDQPTADELLRSLPPSEQQQAIDFIHYLLARKAG
jgi:Predicted transcriptional regulators